MSKLNPFQIRLNKIVEQGKLTRADVAKWCDRRYATVNNWFVKGSAPSGPYAADILASLTRLELLIKKKRGFPVPASISYLERPAYILKVRDGQRKVLKSHTAKKRPAVRRSNGKPTKQPEAASSPATISELA